MIKLRYVYSNKKEIKTFIYTIEEIENNCVYEETIGFSRDFRLISRDRFIGLKDKNGVEIFENDIIKAKDFLTKDNKTYYDDEGLVEFEDGMFKICDEYPTVMRHQIIEIISNTHIEILNK